jgi:hypothetical protein
VSQFSAGKDEQQGLAGGVPEGTEGERRHTAGGVASAAVVPERASRRRFSAAYTLKIVLAAEA